jgi:hypothetical protein
MKKHIILFLAANPAGTAALKLDEEARAIQEELQRATQRDEFAFVTRMAARPLDLLRALRDVRPTIVHFAGHAGADGTDGADRAGEDGPPDRATRDILPATLGGGIYLTGDDGLPARVTRDKLLATVGAAGQSVQIVVLNACSTEDLAKALCELVPVCVGTSARIGDDAARMFSVGFYGALASGESAERACLHGKAAMHLVATGDHDRPHLHHRRDVDPDTLVLAGSKGPVAPAPVVPGPASAPAVPQPPQAIAAAEPPWRPRRRAPALGAVVANYRTRKAGSFERWDLRTAGPVPTVGNRPAEITLDDMYIPLRFAAKLDPARLDRGAPIMAGDLLRPRRRQVLIGSAGSGKTTWMRWTFRRLIRDPRAVPFFLELRAIAAAWETPQDAGRAVDSYLAEELSACGASDAAAIVAALLADPSGPQPVILIDGWDELGAQGERLVEFCAAFQHVVIVVSSRPYGDTRPAGTEAFATLHIQPLSDDDVRLLAARFQRCVHGLDDSAGTRATDEFMAALAAAPDARSLAGTALLLTMMLLLSREGPLPDRRHKLYTACLRNMLLHRVTQRERDGVVADLDQWRPDDSEERLRVVAELAYRMQTEGYKTSHRAPMIRAWNDAVALLKPEWTWDQRDRFLRWLVASAGVLVDRADSSVHFAHLSFQEHLAAYYLFITREGDERVAAVRAHMDDRNWWETLRLWAGLTSDHWPDKLSPVLAMLRENASGYWLAGMIFADGAGTRSDFEAWAIELPARLSDSFASGDGCAQVWGACKQFERRAALATTLASARERLHWLEGTWHAHWCRRASLEVAPAPALLALEAPIGSAGAVARSRVLFGGAASWPEGGELAVLRLWPSARASTGVRLQTAISLGAQVPQIVAMLPALLARATRPWSGEEHALAKNFVRYFCRNLTGDFVRDFARDFVQDFGRSFGRYRYLSRYLDRYSIRDLVGDFGQYFLRNFDGDFAQNLDCYSVTNFGHDLPRYLRPNLVRYFVQDLAGEFVRDLGISAPLLGAPWLPTFAFVETGSVLGRAAPRAALAHGEIPDTPLLALFHTACRASFAPGDASLRTSGARACDAFDGDPLWPALARHVARISTTEDRAVLEDLARHPEKREGPLSWGLQHYVRGDLVFDDHSVVTLDELCAQAGLTPLPLLEPMPDELAIPLDDASS